MEVEKNNKVYCIVGPTASGKTSLSIELAKRVNGEIICADSMQVYKNLDIGTAKIKETEMQGIKHYLYDICEITEKFSVADFKALCYDKIEEILNAGKTPIIVGGTGLYFNAIVKDLKFDTQEIDFEYREYLQNLAKEKSNEYVYNILKEIDKESALQIHPNNLKRVIRAIEIAKYSDVKKSEHLEQEKQRLENFKPQYDFKLYSIDYPREILYDRINKRVDIMLHEGILKEAKYVYDLKLPPDTTCMQAIGYKEFFAYFEGKASLKDCVEKLKQETRRYAKRQITWFKNKLEVKYLDYKLNIEEMISKILIDE